MISANPSLSEPDAHIHVSSPQKLLDTQLSVFPRQALEVGKPASFQPDQPAQARLGGIMSDALTCIRLDTLPMHWYPKALKKNCTTFTSAGKGKSKSCKGSFDSNLQKPRWLCQGSLAPSLEMGSAQFDFDGMHSQKSTASNAKSVIWIKLAIFSRS